jgi:hypothetical protein
MMRGGKCLFEGSIDFYESRLAHCGEHKGPMNA